MSKTVLFRIDAAGATFRAEDITDALLTLAEYFDDLAEGRDPAPIFMHGAISIEQTNLNS